MSKSPISKKVIFIFLITLSLGLIIHDITKKKKIRDTKKDQLYILATTSIIADVLQNLIKGVQNKEGEPRIVIHTLMKIGADPHEYEPTIQDAEHCNSADAIIVSGLNLERTMGHIFANLKQLKPVYIATNTLKPTQIRKDTHFSSGIDPHFWGDVNLMSDVVKHLVDVLQKIDPKHAKHYAKNAVNYQRKLKALDQYIIKKIKKLPPKKRLIIAAHDFLGYFASAYNIEFRSLQGFSTAREITLQRKQSLVKVIMDKGINTIFAETGVSHRGVKSLVETCTFQGHSLCISPKPLYADSIGEIGTPAGSYIGMMKHNVNVIIEALS